MQLEQFVEQLEGAEQVEYQALVEESQNGAMTKPSAAAWPTWLWKY